MNYPSWDVPILGSGLVIAIIAVFHVIISHFAVGGGLYLPMTEARALREGRRDWLDELRKYTRFFLIVTGVFGAVSGVGIWFSISLANPEATSTLIHYFVFWWAMEWAVFAVELSSIAVYYYLWGRISDRAHMIVGWIYFVFAWLSLFIINGILTFMMFPSEAWLKMAGTGREISVFWQAFFNPTMWPSLCLRTLVCFSLAGVFSLVLSSRLDGRSNPEPKVSMVRWAVRWLIPAFILMPFVFAWYLYELPASQRALLFMGVASVGQGMFAQVTRMTLVSLLASATILVVMLLFGWRNARDLTFGQALSILLLALFATASTEQVREMLRKPWVIGRHMYSNGMRHSEVDRFNARGYLTDSIWVKPDEKIRWSTPEARTQAVDIVRGELMFRGQCMACHTLSGYRAMRTLLADHDHKAIANILRLLHDPKAESPYRSFMPLLAGYQGEVEDLNNYLASIVSTNRP